MKYLLIILLFITSVAKAQTTSIGSVSGLNFTHAVLPLPKPDIAFMPSINNSMQSAVMKNFYSIIGMTPPPGVQPNRNGYVHPKVTVTGGTHITGTGHYELKFYKGADTFIVDNNTSDWYLGQDSGLSWERPLVFINHSTKKIRINAIKAENCKYVKFIGFGSDSAYGFEIYGGGVTVDFSGMQNGIMFVGCRITGGINGSIWVKEEANHACDFYNYWRTQPEPRKSMYGNINSYLAPNYQDSIFIRHCLIDSCGGDAYFGTTGGIDGRDAVTCLGNTRPPSMQLHNFHFDSNCVNYIGRSVQLSVCTGGVNTMNDNILTNLGYEWAETGGAQAKSQGGFRTGSGTANLEWARNHVDYTNLYNYDIKEADVNFHDNYGDHVGYVIYHGVPFFGGQALANVNVAASHAQTGATIIKYNKMYNSTASGGINYAIYGGNNFKSQYQNQVCNNTGYFPGPLSLPFNYTTDCGVIPPVDTGCVDSTIIVMHDTIQLAHFDTTFGYKDTVVYPLVSTKITTHRNKSYNVLIKYGVPVDSIVRYIVRLPYDSAYYVQNGALHDSVICVPRVVQTKYGGFILNGYNGLVTLPDRIIYDRDTLELDYMRNNYDFNQTYANQWFLDRGVKPLMTYSPTNGSNPQPLPTLTGQLTKTIDSLLTISKPTLLAWLNEPATIGYWDSTGGGISHANAYLSTYNAVATVCRNHQVLFADGGLTFPIIYSLADYYSRNGKTDSITYLQNVTGISNFTNAPAKIYWRDFYNTLLPGIRAGQADYAQLHWYEPITSDTSITTTSGLLTVVINYIVQQTGKKVITLETGTNNYSQQLFNQMFTEWKRYGAEYIVYYLANPSGAGNPIPNPTFYIDFKNNNP